MNEKNNIIYNYAINYLLSNKRISKEILESYLNTDNYPKPKSFSELCQKMVHHSKNNRYLKNSIGNIDRFTDILYSYDPHELSQKCSNWQDIFYLIFNSNIVPTHRMDINNIQNSWVKFSKSIFSITKFLSKYKAIEEFYDELDKRYNNSELKPSLPLWLSRANNIYGYGFALACDFLKEIGYSDFIKPDIHIRDIFTGIGLSNATTDEQLFIDVIKFSKSINEVPFKVDKVFWLIGSGDFYFHQFKINTYSKDKFILEAKKLLIS